MAALDAQHVQHWGEFDSATTHKITIQWLQGDGNCGYRAIALGPVVAVAQQLDGIRLQFVQHLDQLYAALERKQQLLKYRSKSGGSARDGYQVLKAAIQSKLLWQTGNTWVESQSSQASSVSLMLWCNFCMRWQQSTCWLIQRSSHFSSTNLTGRKGCISRVPDERRPGRGGGGGSMCNGILEQLKTHAKVAVKPALNANGPVELSLQAGVGKKKGIRRQSPGTFALHPTGP
ncbi:hypothetical protein ABBQ38_012682 [Trebouxia sp. C0009 RCD-2024]